MKYPKSYEEMSCKVLVETREIYVCGDINTYTMDYILRRSDYLLTLSTKPIDLIFNSHGGYVDSGLAIYDYIKKHPKTLRTHCTGLAASMAAVLLASGTKGKRTITRNSRVMIHQPSSMAAGKSTDLTIQAQELERMRLQLATLLAEDTGQKVSKILKDIDKDCWMTAEEALKYGLVDKII